MNWIWEHTELLQQLVAGWGGLYFLVYAFTRKTRKGSDTPWVIAILGVLCLILCELIRIGWLIRIGESI